MANSLTPLVKNINAAFFSEIDFSDKLSLAQKISSKFPELFTGDPIILPIPDDAPPEIPRIILQSKDKSYTSNITVNRVDLIYESSDPTMKLDKTVGIFNNIRNYGDFILKSGIGKNINRLGVVINFFIKLSSSANIFLQNKILQEIPSGKPFSSNIHLLYHDKIGNFEINKWIRLNPLRNRKDQEDDSMLQVIFDINTIQEKTGEYKFSKETIDSFYNQILDVVSSDLDGYIK